MPTPGAKQLEQAIALYRDALVHFRAIGDHHEEGQALSKLGWVLRQKNDPADAQSMFEAALRTLRRDFGSGIATLVAGHMALDKISGGRERKMAQALTAISRPDPVKAELRTMLYELIGGALRSAGIYPRHRDLFIDRGDGLLALIHPVDRAPKALLLNRVIPAFSRLPSVYNASLPPPEPSATADKGPRRPARRGGPQ